MFYVYFLRSLKNNDLYIGSCENLNIRIGRHNRGLVKSTKAYKPWQLLGFEEHLTRSDAVRKERFYKGSKERRLLKEKYYNKA